MIDFSESCCLEQIVGSSDVGIKKFWKWKIMSPSVTIPVDSQMIDHVDISRCSVNCGLIHHSTTTVTRANSEKLELRMGSNIAKLSNSCIENPDSLAVLQQFPNKSRAQ